VPTTYSTESSGSLSTTTISSSTFVDRMMGTLGLSESRVRSTGCLSVEAKVFREALGDGVGMRLSMSAYSLRRTPEMPDGHINNGSIITLWCEDGQYIELFQPTVGRLIADFLEAEPENEHAQKIAQEIERIGNREGAHHHER
jgi:hypothetical protein